MQKSFKTAVLPILFGLFLAGVGYWFFADLSALEAKGGSIKVHVVVKMLYELGGKYAVLGVLGGAGALIAGFGAVRLFKRTAQPA